MEERYSARKGKLKKGKGTTQTEDDVEQQRREATNKLFDLAAPAVEGTVVARLVPLSQGMSTLSVERLQPIELRDDIICVKLGRSKQLQLPYRIDHVPRLSALHCTLHVQPDTKNIMIEDTSTNGCFVNGQRVKKHAMLTLHHGDELWLTQPRLPARMQSDPHNGASFSTRDNCQLEEDETSVAYKVDIVYEKREEQQFMCAACKKNALPPRFMLSCNDELCLSCMQFCIEETPRRCPACHSIIKEAELPHQVQHGGTPRNETSCDLNSARDITGLGEDNVHRPYQEALHSSLKRQATREAESAAKRICHEEDWAAKWRWLYSRRQAARKVQQHLTTYTINIPAKGLKASEMTREMQIERQHARVSQQLICSQCRGLFPYHGIDGRNLTHCRICKRVYCSACKTRGTHKPCDSPSALKGIRIGKLKQFLCEVAPILYPINSCVEQRFFEWQTCRSALNSNIVMQECKAKLHQHEWFTKIGTTKIKITKNTYACRPCAHRIFIELFSIYSTSRLNALNDKDSNERPRCKSGKNCKKQYTSISHAVGYNHTGAQLQ